MNSKKTTYYRLYCSTRGVIGPPGLDSDNIVEARVSSFGENRFIEWENAGMQIIDCLDTQLQEFSGHILEWSALVSNKWFELFNNAYLVRSKHPIFILLTGLPGSGKTTLARNLSRKMGWLHFDFAAFAHQVIGGAPLMMSDYKKVGVLAEKKINNIIQNGISIIYDTTSPSATIRQHHLNAVKSANATKYVIYVPTNPDLCLERISLRQPASSIDIRSGIYRSSTDHIRTFWDYVDDFVIPNTCVLANNEFDVSGVLAQLDSRPF